MPTLGFLDNSGNNVIFTPSIYTEVLLDFYTNSANIYTPNIYTLVELGIYNNNSSFYPLTISSMVELPFYTSTTNTFRPIFIDYEPINVSLVTFDNTPLNIVYPPTNITFNFFRELPVYNNTNTFFPLNIGTDRIISLGDLYQNTNYIFPPSVDVENIAFKGVLKRRATITRPKKFRFKFSDISFDMFPHPLTGDVPVIYDVDAINQSLKNIIHTRTFERPFSSYNISSKIHELLFELSGATLENEIKNVLFNAIVNSEPRILLYEINVKNRPELNSVYIQIYYQIRTIDTIEKFETVLTRT